MPSIATTAATHVVRTPLPVLLSGVALGLAHPPTSLSFLAWAALVPLLLRWDDVRTPALILAEAYTAFLVCYAVAFFWPLLTAYSQTFVFSIGGLLLIPLLLALPFALSLPVLRRHGRLAGIATFIVLFLTAEFVLSMGPVAFPWPLLGHTQSEFIDLIQIASVLGVPGVSLWVLLMNACLFGFFAHHRWGRRVTFAVTTAVVFAAPLAFGIHARQNVPVANEHVSVGLVQPGLAADEWGNQFDDERVGTLLSLSDSLIQSLGAPPVFVLWPESAVPAYQSNAQQARIYSRLRSWSNRRQVALLAGALVPAGHTGTTPRYYNSALLFRPYTDILRYDQRHLVPFAEEVPLVASLPWLERFNLVAGRDVRLRAGRTQAVLPFDDIAVGVLLNFESLLSNYARQYARKDADFLVAMTREGWWADAPGHRQRMAYLRFRALETGRAVVQVATNGNTALLQPDGSTVYEIGDHQQIATLAAVPLYQQDTAFMAYGYLFAYLPPLGSLALGLWVVLAWRRRRQRAAEDAERIERARRAVPA